MSQLKKDTQLTLMSRIPVMCLSFLTIVFLTRLLGPEGNGVYTFTLAVLNLLIAVIGFQLDGALPVFLARHKDHIPQILSSTFVLVLLSFIICTSVLSAVVFLIPVGRSLVIPENQPVVFFFGFLLMAFILRRMSSMILATLRGIFRFKAFNTYMILMQLIPALSYGTLLAITLTSDRHISLLTCFSIILAIDGVLLGVGVWLLRQSPAFHVSGDYKLFAKPIIEFSSKNILSTTGHFMNKRLDVWFVQFYRGPYGLGQYGLATQIANFVSDAMTPFNQVMIPYISGTPSTLHKEMVERTARLNITIALIAGAGIVGTSWLFIPLVFGNAFEDAVHASQILAIGILFISQRLVFSGYFKAINELKVPVRAAWLGVLITIFLDLIFIPAHGITGAAWATVASYAITSVYLVMAAKKKLGFSMAHILLIQKSDFQWLLSRSKTEINDDTPIG